MAIQLMPQEPDEDVFSAIEGAVYHIAVPPDEPHERLAMQARIAQAASKLQRPFTKSAFFAAAIWAEDEYLGVSVAWPQNHERIWLSVVRRMWECIAKVQWTSVQ